MRHRLLRLPHWWSPGYFVDYVLVVALFGVCCVVDFAVDPYRAALPLASANPAVAYPYRASSVPTWSAGMLAYICPGIVFAATHAPFAVLGGSTGARLLGHSVAGDGQTWSSVGHELHHAALGLVEAGTLNSLITGIAKDFAGRYRPHYLALAALAHDANSTALEREGRKSFPSGHSSAAFCGLTFLALWLCGKLRVLAPHSVGHFWMLCIVAIPEFAALLVAISRVRDYHHNYSDIVAGGIIGAAIATLVYLALFHSPLSKSSGLPKSRAAGPLSIAAIATAEDIDSSDLLASAKPLQPTASGRVVEVV